MSADEKDTVENRKDMQDKSVQPSVYDGQNPATAGPGDGSKESDAGNTESPAQSFRAERHQPDT